MKNEVLFEILGAAVLLAGLAVFGFWLARTHLAVNSLKYAPIRRNDMPLHLPFMFMFCWLFFSALTSKIAQKFFDQTESLGIYSIRLVVSTTLIIAGLIIAHYYFVRGIKGFGIRFRTLPEDLYYAFLNLLCAWPFIVIGLVVVEFAGKMIVGPDFQLEKHQSLQTIVDSDSMALKIIMVVLITVITPIFEEILFRGLIQSMIRSAIGGPWISIFITSAIFTILHQPQHWMALFAIAVCLGYAYEKSGSLIRPIFIHAIFNTINTVTALYVSLNAG
jgi:membrane protease YdiL (CAAX protease family)